MVAWHVLESFDNLADQSAVNVAQIGNFTASGEFSLCALTADRPCWVTTIAAKRIAFAQFRIALQLQKDIGPADHVHGQLIDRFISRTEQR